MEAPFAELKDRLQEAMNLRKKKAADLANELNDPPKVVHCSTNQSKLAGLTPCLFYCKKIGKNFKKPIDIPLIEW